MQSVIALVCMQSVIALWSTTYAYCIICKTLYRCYYEPQRHPLPGTGLRMGLNSLHVHALSSSQAARPEQPSRSTVLRASLLLQFARRTPPASGRPVQENFVIAMGPSAKLRTGASIPAIGLGVFLAKSGKETYSAVLNSLKIGYRHIDTARMYGNEADVGKAIKASGLSRDQVFVTSKLYDIDWGYEAATSAINKSLKSLDTDYIDLMLMHHPGSRQGRKETWQALEAAHKKVLCRSWLLAGTSCREYTALVQLCRCTSTDCLGL